MSAATFLDGFEVCRGIERKGVEGREQGGERERGCTWNHALCAMHSCSFDVELLWLGSRLLPSKAQKQAMHSFCDTTLVWVWAYMTVGQNRLLLNPRHLGGVV